ncbi:MAG: hypothetical protein KME60_23580 [Cyanomargarita calcarea GSE-NOS-MK-12-04C]|uniref:Uncharacterized protein n=1 Tax=Cyanomargarita calcarea GSE-NOS-MK-12-04C TaxID=2839659 RepID=A0A951QSM6_9CYAN|nr:hypothetical protein [Cyanomargarita calcarea GSE-NOS-MK-12-04C]
MAEHLYFAFGEKASSRFGQIAVLTNLQCGLLWILIDSRFGGSCGRSLQPLVENSLRWQ